MWSLVINKILVRSFIYSSEWVSHAPKSGIYLDKKLNKDIKITFYHDIVV